MANVGSQMGQGEERRARSASRRREVERVREVARGYGPPKGCFACRKPVADAHLKALGRQVFHDSCLRCGACTLVLEPHLTHVKANRIYCTLCFKKAFLPPCRVCAGPVEPRDATVIDFPSLHNDFKDKDPRLLALAIFHAACIRCEWPSCGRQLRPGTAFRNQLRLYCSPPCLLLAREALSLAAPAPSPADQTQRSSLLESAVPKPPDLVLTASKLLASGRDDDASQMASLAAPAPYNPPKRPAPSVPLS